MTIFEDLPSTNTSINASNLNGNFGELNTHITDLIGRAYIEESATTANGSYIKYSNGIMIVAQQYSTTHTGDFTQWGSCYSFDCDTPPDFPVAFTELWSCTKTLSNTGANGWLYNRGGHDTVTRSGLVGFVRPNNSSVSTTIKINVIAIGKWK